MPKHTQAKKPQTERKHQPASVIPTSAVGNLAAVSGEVGSSLETQAARLSDKRMQRAQRQALAVDLGRVSGNQVLQRDLTTVNVDQDPVRTTNIPLQIRVNSRSNRLAAPQGQSLIQRFGSLEHKELGDVGSGGRTYDWAAAPAAYGATPVKSMPFKLTHGDIVMLSGDYFDPRDNKTVDGIDQPNPDSLFRLAATPSPNPGNVPGTQDELLYAIKDINPADPRFSRECTAEQPEGGVWAQIEFSDAVKDAVKNRYLRLASENVEHFAAPRGAEGGPTSGNRASAGGSYRALHEDAILRAFHAGQEKKGANEGLVREAAAQHFLTDNFAAGHLRTPRASITEFWHAKYPLFFANMKKKISLDVARYINEDSTNVATIFGTVSQLYDKVYSSVLEKTENLPELGFEHLVAMVAHDVDNETGLWVINDVGETWKTFGDSNLHKEDADNRTAEMAELAVRLGISDIEQAHSLGERTPATMSDDAILAEVRGLSETPATPGSNYAPEQIIPRPDPSADNGTQTWQASSFDELWSLPARTGGDTFGQRLKDSINSGDIKDTLAGMAAKFPVDEAAPGWSTVHPQKAFTEGFMKPFMSDPQGGLRSIIDYNPSEGQAFFNEDDAVMEEMDKMKKEDIKGFTLNQRADRIRNLISGWTGGDEEERVIELFETAPEGERAQIYRLVEGHAWTGDWIEGWLTSDDDLWNALSRDNLKRLRKIINGQ